MPAFRRSLEPGPVEDSGIFFVALEQLAVDDLVVAIVEATRAGQAFKGSRAARSPDSG